VSATVCIVYCVSDVAWNSKLHHIVWDCGVYRVNICFVSQIIKICLEYIVYDPNYNYDDEHDDDSMETDDDEDAEYVSYYF